MVSNWKNSYEKLENYLKATPAIKIEPHAVFIPTSTKDAFYSHFDEVRENFLQEYFAEEIALGREASTKFKEIESEITSMMKVEREVRIAPPLRWFVNDPANGLARPLLNLLFDLLKGKIDKEIFEESAIKEIGELFAKQFSTTYERLVFLSLVKWLQPTRAFTMPLDDLNLYSSSQEGDSQYERVQMPPDMIDLQEIVLDYATRVSYLAPEIIIYSSILNKYVGLKTGFTGVAWHAKLVSEEREWIDQAPFHQIFSHFNPWPNIMVFIDDLAENIKLIADKTRVCRPDYLIDTVAMNKFFDTKTIERIKAHDAMLNPVLGTAVVSREQAPDEALDALSPQLAPVVANSGESSPQEPQKQNDERASGAEASGADNTTEITTEEEKSEARPINIINAGYDYTQITKAFAPILEAQIISSEKRS